MTDRWKEKAFKSLKKKKKHTPTALLKAVKK